MLNLTAATICRIAGNLTVLLLGLYSDARVKSLGLNGPFFGRRRLIYFTFLPPISAVLHMARRFVQNGNLENIVENVAEIVRKPANALPHMSTKQRGSCRNANTGNVKCVMSYRGTVRYCPRWSSQFWE